MQLNHLLNGLTSQANAPFSALFDNIPDMLVFIKDMDGCYRWANRIVVERAGQKTLRHVLGQTAETLFSGTCVNAQAEDMLVVTKARPIQQCLNSYTSRIGKTTFWCLCSKFPIYDEAGKIVGLVGMSRDLPKSAERHDSYRQLDRFISYISARLEENVLIGEAAAYANLSSDALNRLVMETFQRTPKQFLTQKRISKARELLEESTESITHIAGACGYADHSAFTRQFKAIMQVSPSQYRESFDRQRGLASHLAANRSAMQNGFHFPSVPGQGSWGQTPCGV